jgi:integrase
MLLRDVQKWLDTQSFWQGLAVESKRVYRVRWEQSLRHLGPNKSVNNIKYKEADKLFSDISEEVSKHAAVYACVTCRLIWNRMIRAGHAQSNPFQSMRLPVLPSRTILWQEDEVKVIRNRLIKMELSSLSLAIGMMYEFCQRPNDILGLKRENINRDTLEFIQSKTKTHMNIHIRPIWATQLQMVLRSHNHSHLIISELTGRPWNLRTANLYFGDAKRREGIRPELQLRDLRRTGLTEAADHEATDAELMSLSGHKQVNTLTIYRVRTVRQTQNVLDKRFRDRTKVGVESDFTL